MLVPPFLQKLAELVYFVIDTVRLRRFSSRTKYPCRIHDALGLLDQPFKKLTVIRSHRTAVQIATPTNVRNNSNRKAKKMPRSAWW